MASSAPISVINAFRMPDQRTWHGRCIESLVGCLATLLVLYWKGPVASVMYLLLVAWSFAIYESVLLAQTQASIRTTARSRMTTTTTSGGGTSTRPRGSSYVELQQQVPRGYRTTATTSIAANILSQDLPSSISTREQLSTNNTRSSTRAVVGPSPTAAALTNVGSAAVAPLAEPLTLTPRSRRRRWVSKRPLTPITSMKPCQSAAERYVSPRRPLAPVDVQQRQNARPHAAAPSPSGRIAASPGPPGALRTLPKPWPRSSTPMSKVDRSSPSHRRPSSAATCHSEACCSRSACPFFPVQRADSELPTFSEKLDDTPNPKCSCDK
ncbi:hypothetical protein Mapa_017135 [Marchantia paleacea]|nr:hypothetical protein Mapa_017135 [Marchantia paleacea]